MNFNYNHPMNPTNTNIFDSKFHAPNESQLNNQSSSENRQTPFHSSVNMLANESNYSNLRANENM